MVPHDHGGDVRLSRLHPALAGLALAGLVTAATAEDLVPYARVGNAIPAPLGGLVGEAENGRAVVQDRQRGHCVLCHALSLDDAPLQGTLAPPLFGVAERLTEGEIRARIVDPTRLNADTLMPAYYRVDGLQRVMAAYRGKPVLSAQEVEDVIAYLELLR